MERNLKAAKIRTQQIIRIYNILKENESSSEKRYELGNGFNIKHIHPYQEILYFGYKNLTIQINIDSINDVIYFLPSEEALIDHCLELFDNIFRYRFNGCKITRYNKNTQADYLDFIKQTNKLTEEQKYLIEQGMFENI